jgi:type IV pilus assembly protein PilW
VRNGNLTVCDYMTADCGAAIPLVGTNPNPDQAIWRPVANNVVSLRAEYGRDTSAPMNGTADVFDQTAPTTNCAWARTSAVRLALVARSAQFEKENVTLAAPQWQGTGSATPVLLNVSQNPDGSANALWQRYRYRVFETLVPLRNVAWMGVPQGC